MVIAVRHLEQEQLALGGSTFACRRSILASQEKNCMDLATSEAAFGSHEADVDLKPR